MTAALSHVMNECGPLQWVQPVNCPAEAQLRLSVRMKADIYIHM